MNFWLKLILALSIVSIGHAQDKLRNSIGINLVKVPAGSFQMGTGRSAKALRDTDFPKCNQIAFIMQEQTQFEVKISKSFYLAQTETTLAQFKTFIQATHYQTEAEKNKEGILAFNPVKNDKSWDKSWTHFFIMDSKKSWQDPGFSQADNHPVVGISWNDAKAFCKWLSKKENRTYRLPTEAEWEYACRAQTKTHFSFGNQVRNKIHQYANIGNVELEKKYPDMMQRQWLLDISKEPEDPHLYTSPVAYYPANAWGLHDMHGNVWEWCEDYYQQFTYKQYKDKVAIDPICQKKESEFAELRIVRGGSWYNQPMLTRSAARGFCDAPRATAYIGFRVLCESDE